MQHQKIVLGSCWEEIESAINSIEPDFELTDRDRNCLKMMVMAMLEGQLPISAENRLKVLSLYSKDIAECRVAQLADD